jgi:hypothetical protein
MSKGEFSEFLAPPASMGWVTHGPWRCEDARPPGSGHGRALKRRRTGGALGFLGGCYLLAAKPDSAADWRAHWRPTICISPGHCACSPFARPLARDLSVLVPYQATFARNEIARSALSSACRLRQMM